LKGPDNLAVHPGSEEASVGGRTEMGLGLTGENISDGSVPTVQGWQ